jgi:hypothetical protein
LLRCESPLLALFRLGAMSDLSPQCASKRTSAGDSKFVGSRSNVRRHDVLTARRANQFIVRFVRVKPLSQKDSLSRLPQIKSISISVPSHRGALRTSRTRGGMRWTLIAPEDERRVMRTAKACGPDAPTLASSSRKATFAGDGGKQARSPGRARSNPLKPLRGECRVFPV